MNSTYFLEKGNTHVSFLNAGNRVKLVQDTSYIYDGASYKPIREEVTSVTSSLIGWCMFYIFLLVILLKVDGDVARHFPVYQNWRRWDIHVIKKLDIINYLVLHHKQFRGTTSGVIRKSTTHFIYIVLSDARPWGQMLPWHHPPPYSSC